MHGSVKLDGEFQLVVVSSISFYVDVKLGRTFSATALSVPFPIPCEG